MYIWGKGWAAGRVGSGQTFCQQSRVGSGRVNVSPGRVQEKWPVDNSGPESHEPSFVWFFCAYIEKLFNLFDLNLCFNFFSS